MPELTAEQIIDETVEYYSGHPERFAVTFYGTCQYRTDAGQMCAVGRCLDPAHPRFEEIVKHCGGVETLISHFACRSDVPLENQHFLNTVLKPQYRGAPVALWAALQELHDNSADAHAKQKYWTESRMLNAEGLKYVEKVKKHYA